MKKLAIAFILVVAVSCAVAQDSWSGRDKRWHAGFSCFFAAGATAWRPEAPAWQPFLIAMIPGTIKEASDATTQGGTGWSWKDMGANALGAGLCIPIAGALVRAERNQLTVTFQWQPK